MQEVIPGRAGVQVRLEDRKGDQDLTVEAVLVAVGVTGNVDGLGLEAMGIRPEKGFVPVNEYQQTSVPSVYAIGDVAGPPWLAHVASAEGHVAAEHAAGKNPRPLRKETIPGCTYCRPEVASVGLTEAIARERFETVNVGRFDFRANGRALAAGEGEGFVKLVFAGPYGELVGAHILGGHATEMIAELATAMTLEATWAEIGSIVHPHPTWSEAVMEAALDARGRAIHH
ncbi:MAG: hypothetical protein D6762_02240 [Candidatus Neomarinimicrobiota bacterium]|nr:MAG: hypothetical protein D6762_02240 [Candidatus Neomarinimicrobiota bacterium]